MLTISVIRFTMNRWCNVTVLNLVTDFMNIILCFMGYHYSSFWLEVCSKSVTVFINNFFQWLKFITTEKLSFKRPKLNLSLPTLTFSNFDFIFYCQCKRSCLCRFSDSNFKLSMFSLVCLFALFQSYIRRIGRQV